MEKRNNNDNVKIKVPWYGYVVFVLAILLFSGVFSSSDGILRALDFNVLNGSFGQIPTDKAMSFRGAGGSGAKDGFLFALELIPAVILALGIVNVIDGLGGLKAAQKIMNPLLKPLLGVPGISALANIANMQSTDAAAGMVKELKDNNLITDKERSIIIAYQTSGSAFITNYFSSGAAAFSILMAPIIVPIFVIFIFKIVGANFMRLFFIIFSL